MKHECDSQSIYEFLQLLKQPESIQGKQHFQPINIEEWKTVVGRVKKRSASLIHLLRSYIIHKCTHISIRMIMILVRCYNLIIERQFYLSRWLKTLDVILEKGKGPVVDKLCTI